MPRFVRVKEKATGHHVTIRDVSFREDKHQLLKQDATTPDGRLIAPVHKNSATSAASASTSTTTPTKE